MGRGCLRHREGGRGVGAAAGDTEPCRGWRWRDTGRAWVTFNELDHPKILSSCEMLCLDVRMGWRPGC